MVAIPAGLYDFYSRNNCIEGDPLPEAVGVQMPWQLHPQRAHSQRMRINAFYMDRHLVTNAKYRAFLDEWAFRMPIDTQNWLRDWNQKDDISAGNVPEVPPGLENHPVRWVSRNDAEDYCRHYDKRLPHSWEWQYAAQGTDGRTYPWGDSFIKANVPPLSNARTMPALEDVGGHPSRGRVCH